jgi:hypothetical protein
MNGLFERGALISLPARELAATTPPASVFPVEALDGANLSPALRSALDLVASCAPPDRPRLIVARPEMFTHGATLEWLNQALQGVSDHVALSDGETVRLVPGLRNHVYFYALGQSGSLGALERLQRRAPELFTQLHSQVNSALAFRCHGRRFAPLTQVLMADPPDAPPALRPLAVDRPSLDASLAAAPVSPGPFATLHYLRLSQSALIEASVARRVTALVAEALGEASRAVVWALPAAIDDVGALTTCLRAGGGRLPPGLMPNVFFTRADLAGETLARLATQRTLVTDDFADVSRAADDFLEGFGDVLVYARPGRHMPAQFHDLLQMVYGLQTRIDWLRSDARLP